MDANDLGAVCGYAYHSSEIVLVFKSPQGYNITFTDNDTLASDIFTSYMSGLAMCGSPSKGCSNLQLDAAVDWPPYSIENNWDNILIDVPHSEVQSNYREDFCDMWDATGFYVNITVPETTTVPQTTEIPITTTTKQTETTLYQTTKNTDSENTTSGAERSVQLGSFFIIQFLCFTLRSIMH
ncbi:uncharacterized protein LOC144742633 [Ciona intestinalis]